VGYITTIQIILFLCQKYLHNLYFVLLIFSRGGAERGEARRCSEWGHDSEHERGEGHRQQRHRERARLRRGGDGGGEGSWQRHLTRGGRCGAWAAQGNCADPLHGEIE
jgi:hypothetical protein